MNVVPVPDWVGRVGNANAMSGARQDKFIVWPALDPSVRIAKGEQLRLSLRVTLVDKDVSQVTNVAPITPPPGIPASQGLQQAGNAGASNSPTPTPLPEGKLTYQIRPGVRPGVYWLDVDIGPIEETGAFSHLLAIPASGGELAGLSLNFTITAVVDEFLVVPESPDFGEVNLANLEQGMVQVGRLGLRRPLRKFRIKELGCSLPFLHVTSQTIVEGNNYFIKVALDNNGSVKAGQYEGTIHIITDDKSRPVIEAPFKIKLTR